MNSNPNPMRPVVTPGRLCRTVAGLCCLSLLLGIVGCSTGATAIPTISINADRIAQQIVRQYDTNNSGTLRRDEVQAVPPIAARFSHFDIDGDGEISVDELATNLRRIFDPSAAVITASCVVHANGRPLPGAEVRLVPIPELEDTLPVGTGVSDSSGTALVTAAREQMPGNTPTARGLMRPGLYLVEVTHESRRIPEKYNRQTVLGIELSGQTAFHEPDGLLIKLEI